MSSGEVRVTMTHVPNKAGFVRSVLLSYIAARGATHHALVSDYHDGPICPTCTYESDDVLVGVPWPCDHAEETA